MTVRSWSSSSPSPATPDPSNGLGASASLSGSRRSDDPRTPFPYARATCLPKLRGPYVPADDTQEATMSGHHVSAERREGGRALAEYALALALIAILATLALVFVGGGAGSG